MGSYALLVGAAVLAVSACTTVAPLDYARTLCDGVPRDEYSACASRVLDHHRSWSLKTDLPFGYSSTSGPLAMVVGGELYLGSYQSTPFVASFRATSEAGSCRGAYDAFTGSRDAIFAVQCSDGREGTADLTLDQSGRNGIGEVSFADGSTGRIAFGHGAAGAPPFAEG